MSFGFMDLSVCRKVRKLSHLDHSMGFKRCSSNETISSSKTFEGLCHDLEPQLGMWAQEFNRFFRRVYQHYGYLALIWDILK